MKSSLPKCSLSGRTAGCGGRIHAYGKFSDNMDCYLETGGRNDRVSAVQMGGTQNFQERTPVALQVRATVLDVFEPR